MGETSGLFSSETRKPDSAIFLKISEYEDLIRNSERALIIQNAIYAGIPREEIIKIIGGKPPELEAYEKTGMSPDEIRQACVQLEEAKTSIGLHEEREKALQDALDKLKEDYDQVCQIGDDLNKELEEAKNQLEKLKEKEKQPKKRAEPANKKKLDIGKIRALREAGWSFGKIAEEMGCSPQTVANALQREETAKK